MVMVCSVEEINRVAEAARKVGGYDELLRLERERRALADPWRFRVVKTSRGTFTVLRKTSKHDPR